MDNKTVKLEIEYVDIDLLQPYEHNSRKHQKLDIDVIKESIKQFGFNDPIAVWGKDLKVVCGHGRILAAKELGIKQVPIIHLDHLTDEERKAYCLAHNRSAELSTWDFDELESELKSLEDEFDLDALGFDELIRTPDFDDEGEVPELKNHSSGEKEIECPYCGGKILL